MPKTPIPLTLAEARRVWLRAQRLDTPAPFGAGPEAVRAAVEHLGYVQIDTINVIERAHHHILWSRIPEYRRADLDVALSVEKTVFEYWAHALAYLPARDLRYFLPEMARHRENPEKWFASVAPSDLRRLIARIRAEGPLSIRDIEEERVEKDHAWASRKPSKRALQLGFFAGLLTISARTGMVKTYELTERHFGWERRPRPPSAARVLDYLLDRALGAQGLVSLDSICYLDAGRKPAMAALIEARVRRGRLAPVALDGGGPGHWMAPGTAAPDPSEVPARLLSPFDPLVIQRKRLNRFFGYAHLFEAYVPRERRVLGYFALPALVDDRIVAALDLKTDRAAGKVLIQRWTPVGAPAAGDKARIEEALGRFKAFQLGR